MAACCRVDGDAADRQRFVTLVIRRSVNDGLDAPLHLDRCSPRIDRAQHHQGKAAKQVPCENGNDQRQKNATDQPSDACLRRLGRLAGPATLVRFPVLARTRALANFYLYRTSSRKSPDAGAVHAATSRRVRSGRPSSNCRKSSGSISPSVQPHQRARNSSHHAPEEMRGLNPEQHRCLRRVSIPAFSTTTMVESSGFDGSCARKQTKSCLPISVSAARFRHPGDIEFFLHPPDIALGESRLTRGRLIDAYVRVRAS